MDQRSGIGCGTLLGATILGGAGLFLLFAASFVDGSIGGAVFLAAMAMPGLLGAAQLVRSDLRGSAERRRAAMANMERRILGIAAAHEGRISPAMVTMEVPGVDIAGARRHLDAMAREGYCTVDSDDSGRPFYTFPIGPPATDDVSPEDWVKQVSGVRPRTRMTGEQTDDQTTRTEA